MTAPPSVKQSASLGVLLYDGSFFFPFLTLSAQNFSSDAKLNSTTCNASRAGKNSVPARVIHNNPTHAAQSAAHVLVATASLRRMH